MANKPALSESAELLARVVDAVQAKLQLPLLLPQPAAWRYVGLSRTAWFKAKAAGRIPKPVRTPAGSFAWRRRDLEDFVERLPQFRGRAS